MLNKFALDAYIWSICTIYIICKLWTICNIWSTCNIQYICNIHTICNTHANYTKYVRYAIYTIWLQICACSNTSKMHKVLGAFLNISQISVLVLLLATFRTCNPAPSRTEWMLCDCTRTVNVRARPRQVTCTFLLSLQSEWMCVCDLHVQHMWGKDSKQQQCQHKKSLLTNLNRAKPSFSRLHHKQQKPDEYTKSSSSLALAPIVCSDYQSSKLQEEKRHVAARRGS